MKVLADSAGGGSAVLFVSPSLKWDILTYKVIIVTTISTETKSLLSKIMIIDLVWVKVIIVKNHDHRESTTRRTWWMRWIGTECGLRVSGMGGVAWRRFTYSSLLFVLLPNIFIFSCRSLPCFFAIYIFNWHCLHQMHHRLWLWPILPSYWLVLFFPFMF